MYLIFLTLFFTYTQSFNALENKKLEIKIQAVTNNIKDTNVLSLKRSNLSLVTLCPWNFFYFRRNIMDEISLLAGNVITIDVREYSERSSFCGEFGSNIKLAIFDKNFLFDKYILIIYLADFYAFNFLGSNNYILIDDEVCSYNLKTLDFNKNINKFDENKVGYLKINLSLELLEIPL